MPITILKKVWDYCKHDKKFLLLIIILIIFSTWLEDYSIYVINSSNNTLYLFIASAVTYLSLMFMTGYGISITMTG